MKAFDATDFVRESQQRRLKALAIAAAQARCFCAGSLVWSTLAGMYASEAGDANCEGITDPLRGAWRDLGARLLFQYVEAVAAASKEISRRTGRQIVPLAADLERAGESWAISSSSVIRIGRESAA